MSRLSQVKLLQARGDVENATISFEVNLAAPSSLTESNHPLSRLGFDVQETGTQSLQVANVDTRVRKFTPVAQWNSRELQQADRVDFPLFFMSREHHAPRHIRPGDRICAVNGGRDNMLEQLKSAASIRSPKALALQVERAASDIVSPTKPQRSASLSRSSIGCQSFAVSSSPSGRQQSMQPKSSGSVRPASKRSNSRSGIVRSGSCPSFKEGLLDRPGSAIRRAFLDQQQELFNKSKDSAAVSKTSTPRSSRRPLKMPMQQGAGSIPSKTYSRSLSTSSIGGDSASTRCPSQSTSPRDCELLFAISSLALPGDNFSRQKSR